MSREAVDCERYREQIALHVEGDLDAAAARRLARHLDGCAPCRVWAEEMAASQQALRRQLEPPVDAATLARIRAGVLAEISRRHRRAVPVRWLALAATLLAALALWRFWEPRPAAPPPPEPAATAAVPPPVTAEEVETAPEPAVTVAEVPAAPSSPHRQPSSPPPPAAAVAPRERRPLLIKLTSPDQDLVIYWLVDPTEKKEHEHESATVL